MGVSSIWVLHGPNLNLLGTREPALYGKQSLKEIDRNLKQEAHYLEIKIESKQTNSETQFIEWIHQAQHEAISGLLVNAAAWSHTSLAIRDALLATLTPFVEVHLSNIAQRETFRQHSYLADIALGTIQGFGGHSYSLALQAMVHHLKQSTQ